MDAVADAIDRHGATRVALILGTSTASIGATEDAYRRLDHGRFPEDLQRPEIHTPHSLAGFVADATGIAGPALTISTACSSSAKVFASAERLIRLGLADAALVGGVDTLCDSVLFGFHSLELVSTQACRPFDAQRDGISIGEAAAFVLLERADGAPHAPRLLGHGESSDAHHLSTPHPEGRGAQEAVFALLAIEYGFVPPNLGCSEPMPEAAPWLVLQPAQQRVDIALSNSFGFGGNNACLVFGRGAAA
jgi:3-oxoacyl-[acyl-carrier-protein] synthase-1